MTDDLRDTLWRLERALAAADPTGVDGGLEGLLAEGFQEFGASGRTWDEASMRQTLAGACPRRPWTSRTSRWRRSRTTWRW